MDDKLGLYVALIFTFAAFSYLWKENIAYRIAEHTFVGLAAGRSVANNWHNYLRPVIQNDIATDGKYWYILLMIIGLFMYARYTRKWLWLSRIPIALEVGYGVGYGLALGPRTFLRSLDASFINVIVKDDAGNFIFSQSFNQLLFFIIIITVLSYFIFTRDNRTGVLKVTSSFGRWAMMIAFGASFGNTIMARIALLIGQLQFILGDWLGLIPS